MIRRRVKKTKKFQPSREKLTKAVNEILDKAINADSKNAPKQLHHILTTEHPQWKLTERRVAKYLKRELKKRNNSQYKDIDADLDEVSLYSSTSNSTWKTVETAPAPEPEAKPAPEKEEEKIEAEAKEEESVDVSNVESEAPTETTELLTEVKSAITEEAYEDEQKKEEKETPLFCNGCTCIIS